MLFNLFRILLWVIASLVVVIKIKSTKVIRKKIASLLGSAICLILISVSAMYPIENLFINFESPESVFHYTCFGEVHDVLYGKESCMAVYSSKNNIGRHYILPKTEKGYKIPNYFAVKKILNKFDRNGNFDVYHVLGTQDYYVIGTILSDMNEQIIVDSNNQPVKSFSINMGETETKAVIIYSYVENFNNDYYLLINGIKTTITE